MDSENPVALGADELELSSSLSPVDAAPRGAILATLGALLDVELALSATPGVSGTFCLMLFFLPGGEKAKRTADALPLSI
jgi:hypothetical protein